MTIRARFRLLLALATLSLIVVSVAFSLAGAPVSVVLAFLCFLVLVLVTTAICRSVLGSIEQLLLVLRDSHHRRWYTKNESAWPIDEFAPIIAEVTGFLDRLDRSAEALTHFDRQLGTLCEHLSACSREQQRADRSLRLQSQKNSGILNAIAGASDQIAGDTSSIRGVSKQAIEQMRQKNRCFGELLQTTGDLTSSSENAAKQLEKLHQTSAQISGIVELIEDIADQSKLLALNAAIEAAHAAEHGRGFGVVADEVGKLAQRTRAATEQIRLLMKNTQEQSEAATRAIQAATKNSRAVAEGTRLATESAANWLETLCGLDDRLSSLLQSCLEQSRSLQGAMSVCSQAWETPSPAAALLRIQEEVSSLRQSLQTLVPRGHAAYSAPSPLPARRAAIHARLVETPPRQTKSLELSHPRAEYRADIPSVARPDVFALPESTTAA